MRAQTVLAVITASLLMTTALTAAEVPAPSAIDAVTVFPQGAEVTRFAKVKLQPGEHTILITDLPPTAIGNSIRVEGKSTGGLAIGSVDTRRTFIQRGEIAERAAERKRLEGEIEKLNDERELLNATIEGANAQKKLFTELAGIPGKPVPAGMMSPQMPDWGQLGALIGDRTVAAQKVILETNQKIRDVDRKMEDLQKRLASIAPAQEERTEVKVAVNAGAAVEADLTIRYQVQNAGWTPLYDARLTTGTKAAPPKLQFVRRASIQQRTGEAWDNVAISLSTTRPSQGSQAPDLLPMLVDLLDPSAPNPRRMALESAPPPSAMAAPMAADAVAAGVAQGRAKMAAPIQQINATIDANAFQALYGIPGRSSVQTTGEAKRVQIDATDLDPTLVVRTVPKRDPKAFLYAKLTTPKTTAILAGAVSLFRDGTYVGNGRLPQLAPGEDHELGFGQDDNVMVKYAVLDEKRGEKGIITSSKTEEKTFKITVKSLHQRPVAVRVIDQFPVSNNQELKVETSAKVQPTGRDLDDKRGVVHWDFNINPDEERLIEFGHKLTWPAAKQLSRS
jgi:uncharacterized protein (TIGR02231 family)